MKRTLSYMARRRFFVREVSRGRAVVSGDDAHHLTRVLRVEAGQKYEISDNRGVYLAEVETARKDLVEFSILEPLASVQPVVEVSLYVALVKFERLELLIEKATELGAAGISLFEAERSERGLEGAAVKRLTRWQRIAQEASEQSRRAHLPNIEAPARFEEIVRKDAHWRLLLDELGDAPPLLRALPPDPHRGESAALLVGPEGGWTSRERDAIREAGWQSVSLGSTVLRTETAALAALAVINAKWAAAG